MVKHFLDGLKRATKITGLNVFFRFGNQSFHFLRHWFGYRKVNTPRFGKFIQVCVQKVAWALCLVWASVLKFTVAAFI